MTQREELAEALLFNGRYGTESEQQVAARRIKEREQAAALLRQEEGR